MKYHMIQVNELQEVVAICIFDTFNELRDYIKKSFYKKLYLRKDYGNYKTNWKLGKRNSIYKPYSTLKDSDIPQDSLNTVFNYRFPNDK